MKLSVSIILFLGGISGFTDAMLLLEKRGLQSLSVACRSKGPLSISGHPLQNVPSATLNTCRRNFYESSLSRDREIWKLLANSKDYCLQKYLALTLKVPEMEVDQQVEGTCISFTTKFRGVDPWIKCGDTYFQLSHLDTEFQGRFARTQCRVKNGLAVVSAEIAAIISK